jgi:hypothetical protein
MTDAVLVQIEIRNFRCSKGIVRQNTNDVPMKIEIIEFGSSKGKVRHNTDVVLTKIKPCQFRERTEGIGFDCCDIRELNPNEGDVSRDVLRDFGDSLSSSIEDVLNLCLDKSSNEAAQEEESHTSRHG